MFIECDSQNRKRKGPSSSGAANSTGTGNTIGPNSQPSTPSTHAPGDGAVIAPNMQNVNSMQKGLMLYGNDGTGGLASSTNQLVKELITSTVYYLHNKEAKFLTSAVARTFAYITTYADVWYRIILK